MFWWFGAIPVWRESAGRITQPVAEADIDLTGNIAPPALYQARIETGRGAECAAAGGAGWFLDGGAEMAETADVVVIGGGCIGTSIAWQLAGRGTGRVVVPEQGGVSAVRARSSCARRSSSASAPPGAKRVRVPAESTTSTARMWSSVLP